MPKRVSVPSRSSSLLVKLLMTGGLALVLTVGSSVLAPASATASGNRLLIVAPHPDDETLYGAGVAASGVAAGKTVKVLYLTNGDINGTLSGLARQDNAVLVQTRYIGTSESDLVFLGYPDSQLQNLLDNYPLSTDAFITSFGQSSTYGARGLGSCDFHTYRFGSPASYNAANVLRDMETVLDDFRPDDIYVTSEFDHHSDHVASYRVVKTALDRSVTSDPSYRATIHKTIVWTTDPELWPAPTDPQVDQVEIPGLAQTGLVWRGRESIRVPAAMQMSDLTANSKYLAIQAYGGNDFLRRFVHRDEIFWIDNPDGTNHMPVAAVGPAQAIPTSGAVQLDGSGSSDPDGDVFTYQWTQTAGPAVTLSDATAAQPRFTAPASAASLTFQLVVNDGKVNSAPDSVTITVQAPSGANIASAAVVTASSESPGTGQLAIKAVDGVATGYPIDYTKEWATNGGKAGSWLRLTWGSAATVNRIVLYDRPNLGDQITAATITFSDGTSLATGSLPNDGSALTLTFPDKTITSLQLTVDAVSASTQNVGLCEIEVYEALAPATTNVALNKAATASSTYSSTYAAPKAVDGSTSTYWRSNTTGTQWLTVDIGGIYDLTEAVIAWNGSYYARAYRVEVSTDSSTWTKVYSTWSGTSGTKTHTFTARARYVRLCCTSANSSSYRVEELEAWGVPAPKGTVSGRITSGGTGVSGATIAGGGYAATTDADGNYMITNVVEGNYTVTASKTGYDSQSKSATVYGGQTTAVDFTLAVQTAPSNLALNKTASASGSESGYPPSYAVDGKTSTRWWRKNKDTQWLRVDLGASYSVDKVVLNWHSYYAKEFRIEVSGNDKDWTRVYETKNGAGGTSTITFAARSARYVRVCCTKANNDNGYSIYEFEAYKQ